MPITDDLPSNTPLLVKARAIADLAHAGQWYGDLPYIVHLVDVEQVVRRFGIPPQPNLSDEDILAAALTHDTLEDTFVTREYLEQHLGAGVAQIVWAVTDKLDRSHSRSERHRATYPSLPDTPGAVRVKLSDRIANVEAAVLDGGNGGVSGTDSRLAAMYVKEHDYFRECLYQAGSPEEPLWAYLDGLIGRIRLMASVRQVAAV